MLYFCCYLSTYLVIDSDASVVATGAGCRETYAIDVEVSVGLLIEVAGCLDVA